MNSTDVGGLSKPFASLIENPALTYQLFDMFPIPIEIFAPDGTTVYVNRALLELNNIPDTDMIVGKYNLLNDPVSHKICGYNSLKRMFEGESVVWTDIPVPIQDLVDRGVVDGKPFEAAYMDVTSYPVWDDGTLVYVVCIFIVKRIYQGKPDVAKAKDYIDSHWRDDYDLDAIAKAASMSPRQLYNLFSRHTGLSPKEYHKKCKVDRIKEKLADKNLTIAEAFAACGVDNRGTYARVFREIVGISPKEYRASIT